MKKSLILVALLLTACTSALPTPAPISSPVIWQVQGTPTLNWLAADFNRCAQQQTGINIVYLQRPAPSLDPSAAEFILRWGAPSGLTSPASIIGEDELVFIVHPSNPLSQLSQSDLRALLSGKITTWDKLPPATIKETIKVYTYAAGEDIQQVLESTLPNLPVNRETGWLAPDPASVRQAVAASPVALGYIPKRWLDSSVKTVNITDLPAASLRQPLLAITRAQPGDAQKIFLQCLSEAVR